VECGGGRKGELKVASFGWASRGYSRGYSQKVCNRKGKKGERLWERIRKRDNFFWEREERT